MNQKVRMMSKLTLNIYPQGHYHYVPPQRRYAAGKRIINRFLNRNLIECGEYSILVYDQDRVKIEITREKDLDFDSFKDELNNERDRCTIACWKVADSDTVENMRDKCKATELREELLKDTSLLDLGEREWIEEINLIVNLWKTNELRLSLSNDDHFEITFLHYIMTPPGSDNENRIRSRIGLPLISQL